MNPGSRRNPALLAAVLAAAGLLSGGPWTGAAEARGFRGNMLPNAEAVGAGCNLCHVSGGGSPRNGFGLDVEALVTVNGREVFWTPELAALDSDGDGFTNGEELGDPEGTWEAGDDPPGDAAQITNPADAESRPPEAVSTAVGKSTWARIKALVESRSLTGAGRN